MKCDENKLLYAYKCVSKLIHAVVGLFQFHFTHFTHFTIMFCVHKFISNMRLQN